LGKPFQIVDTTFLEKALNAASLRGQVISNNLSNVNNPDYQAQSVVFDSHLREAMDAESANGKDGEWKFKSNLPPEMQIADAGGWTKANLRPTIETVGGAIDVNTEMASLAKNQILYNAYTAKVSGIYGSLKWIVENSGR
jgi:flagellar basal-body rod protein FlgB